MWHLATPLPPPHTRRSAQLPGQQSGGEGEGIISSREVRGEDYCRMGAGGGFFHFEETETGSVSNDTETVGKKAHSCKNDCYLTLCPTVPKVFFYNGILRFSR